MSPEAPDKTNTSNKRTAAFSILALIIAITIALFWGDSANLFGLRRFFSTRPGASVAAAPSVAAIDNTSRSQLQSKMKTPIYFLSHGGVSLGFKIDQKESTNIVSRTSCTTSSTRPTANSPRSAVKSRPRSSLGQWLFSRLIGKLVAIRSRLILLR